MTYPHIETAADYETYTAAVDSFFQSEGIENLTTGHIKCPECDCDFVDEKCPECESGRECLDEPYFSWRPCECCDRTLGGDREHATGYNRKEHAILEYEICTDCAYFAEYGELDDMTMLKIEETA